MNKFSYSLIVIGVMGLVLGFLIIDNKKAWNRVEVQEKFLKDTYTAARALSSELKSCQKKLR